MTVRQPAILTPRYYLDNFQYVLTIVRRLYSGLLNDAERDFLARFDTLSLDAQSLFVRMSNRRGRFFRAAKFNYPEITDLSAALAELMSNGFAEPLTTHHEPLASEALDVFTKAELLARLPLSPEELKPLAKLKKDEIVGYVCRELDFGPISTALSAEEVVIKLNFEAEVRLLIYLFFGNRGSDMSEFVMRDLGMVNFERYDDSQLTARFRTRKEVEDKLLISLTNEIFYTLKTAETPPHDVYGWFLAWNDNKPALSPIAIPSYEWLVCKVGAFLERAKRPDEALTVYALASRVPARERRVRLLYKTGSVDEALALCEEIAMTPQNAEERYFATDFRAKMLGESTVGKIAKKRPRKQTTRFLSDAESISIPAAYRHHVEAGVMNYYLEQGRDAAFTENYPWRGLFGLVFWDIIHDTGVSAIHHPLQRGPSDFYLPDFFAKREPLFRQRLAELTTRDDWHRHAGRTFMAKYGLTNTLVDWNDELLVLVKRLIDLLDSEQLGLILLEMAGNVREHTHGFPDLLVWQADGSYSFVEVKSPTDHLGPQQLHWMEFFQTIGVPARVVRVVWSV
jgi:hypothetical protein